MKRTAMKHKGLGRRGIGLVILLIMSLSLSTLSAAREEGPLKSILDSLATYDFAVGVGAPLRLRAFVLARKDNPAARKDIEAELLAFLQSEATWGGKMEACRSLRLIGSPSAVPVLENMLGESETADMARFALEKIPGEEADRALIAALDKAQNDLRRGIIFSIGERAALEAIPALERIVNGEDDDEASDAVKALGKIGGPRASSILTDVLTRAPEPLKSEAASALLFCAESLLERDRGTEASALYDEILNANTLPSVRRSAFKGKVGLAGDQAKTLIMKTLAGGDPDLYSPAIAMIPKTFQAADMGALASLISREELPGLEKTHLVAVIAGYPLEVAGPALLAAAESPSAFVRHEALRSIGRVGDGTFVDFLARNAAQARGTEQALARESLWRLKGKDADAAITALLKRTADDDVQAELIQAVTRRRIVEARPALEEAVLSGASSVRTMAAGALRDISTEADLRNLMELLFLVEENGVREDMQNAVAAVARTNPRPLARGNACEAMLQTETNPRKKNDLLRVLGKIGDDTALPLIRQALNDPEPTVVDAAVRALADWPTGMARDDVLAIARTSKNLTYKVLALRAFVRMIGLEPYRAPEGAVADLARALEAADRAEEKRLILGLLPRFPCARALEVAESLAADESVTNEAQLALGRIRKALAERR